MVVKISLTGRV